MLSKQEVSIASDSVLFKNVPPDLFASLLKGCRKISTARGRNLFIQGDAAKNVYVILKGWMKLTRITPAGDNIVLTVYSTGESFGEAAALQQGLYPVTAEAVTDCELLSVPTTLILNALKTDPTLAAAMLSCTFQHLHELVLDIESLKAMSGNQRLAAFLIALAPVGKGSCTFSLPYDKTLIASRLGMKPESLSRGLSRLRDIGVKVSGNKIAITDVGRLHDFAEFQKTSEMRWSGS